MSHWVILGCGYIGTRLARRLLADGQRVRVCARQTKRLAPLAEAGAEVHQLDAAKSRAFGPALSGVAQPIVVYSIPPVAGMPAGEAVRRAAEAAMAAGSPCFLLLGSTAVYGDARDGDVIDEESPVAISDPEASGFLREEASLETARMTGLHTIVLRLTAVYGPGRGVRERLRAGTYKLVDEGRHVYSRVHVDDVVGIIRAAVEKAPSGAIYCISDDRPTTQKEYADWLVKRLGVSPPPSVEGLAPGMPRIPIRNRFVKNDKLKRELGYTFRYPTYVEGEQAVEAEMSAKQSAEA